LTAWKMSASQDMPIFSRGTITWYFCATSSSIFVFLIHDYLCSVSLGLLYIFVVIMAALCNRAGHYIFALWFLSIFFFFFLAESHRSEIGCLPYFHTWCGLSANLASMSDARCLAVSCAGTLHMYIFRGLLPLTEFCQVPNSVYVQVLRSPILAALLHGTLIQSTRSSAYTLKVGVSQTLRR